MQIVLLDIETLPNTVATWAIYKQHALEVLEYPSVACYSAKYLNGKHITRSIPDTISAHVRDDKALVLELWEILDKADVVIAHYGDGFDLPFLRARFAKYGLAPPSPFKSIDTKKIVAKLFYFGGAYNLGHVCSYLGLGKKMPTGGYELWQGCMVNDTASWARMKKYNKHDVVLLELLYRHLLPWMDTHPNVCGDLSGCPKCGSSHIQSRGTMRSNTRVYNRYQCQECHGWSRSTRSILSAKVTNA